MNTITEQKRSHYNLDNYAIIPSPTNEDFYYIFRFENMTKRDMFVGKDTLAKKIPIDSKMYKHLERKICDKPKIDPDVEELGLELFEWLSEEEKNSVEAGGNWPKRMLAKFEDRVMKTKEEIIENDNLSYFAKLHEALTYPREVGIGFNGLTTVTYHSFVGGTVGLTLDTKKGAAHRVHLSSSGDWQMFEILPLIPGDLSCGNRNLIKGTYKVTKNKIVFSLGKIGASADHVLLGLLFNTVMADNIESVAYFVKGKVKDVPEKSELEKLKEDVEQLKRNLEHLNPLYIPYNPTWPTPMYPYPPYSFTWGFGVTDSTEETE